jgi:hypothetical protein
VSRLGDELAAILAALEAADVRAAVGGQLTAPCVLVQAGDPWSTPVRLPGRVGRWRLSAVAGAVDTRGGLEELAELVDAIDAALRTVDGCGLPTWGRPTVVTLDDGVRRPATVGTIEYASS